MNDDSTQWLVDRICDDYRLAWQAGQQPDLKDWITKGDPALHAELLRELANVDFERRALQDPGLQIGTYLAELRQRFPETTLTETDLTGRPSASQVRNSPTPGVFSPPPQIGKFRIQRELGRGGFGIVYLAEDEILKREVALKISRDAFQDRVRDRIINEAKATAGLNHPGIVRVYEAGEIDGICCIASAFCEGPNLAQWLKSQTTISVELAAEIVRDLAEAIAHAHARGVVHRDLKPGNVLLEDVSWQTADGRLAFAVRITDFGLAKLVEQRLDETESSILIGTPCYMAPELFQRSRSNAHAAACDVYSLGVILFELLSLRRPFEGSTMMEVMDAIRHQEPTSLSRFRRGISADLETVCLKCLQKNPTDRYRSAGELAADLNRFLRGEPIAAARPGVLTHVKRELVRPERIQEAGMLSIMLGIGLPIWALAVIFLIQRESLEVDIRQDMIPSIAILVCLIQIPLIWSGYRSLRGDRRWMRVGLGISCIHLITVALPLFGITPAFSNLYARYPMARILVYSLLTLIFAIQVLQYTIILALHPRNADSG
ncbi:MAG: serine/threonine protein kinase [Planctomycetaceae bacterium]|nr:serine/threonine protein kinase [Planctomycetaceae bacterium]